MSDSDDKPLHFEKEFGQFSKLGTLIIKGAIDKASGNIKGEIGVKALGVYRSLKPSAGNLHDGVHGQFATGIGYGDSSFSIGFKDGALKAQANLWEKGTEITLFKMEEVDTSWHGTLKVVRNGASAAFFVILRDSGNNYILQLPDKFPWGFLKGETSVVGTMMKKPNQMGRHSEDLDYKARFQDTGVQMPLSNGSLIRVSPPTDEYYHDWIKAQEGECFTTTGKGEYYLQEVPYRRNFWDMSHGPLFVQLYKTCLRAINH